MKKEFIYIVLAIAGAFVFNWLFGMLREYSDANIKSKPRKYAYYYNNLGVISRPLVADNKECLKLIINFHKKRNEYGIPLPSCVSGVIERYTEVYVLEDIDSVTAKVGWYIKKKSGVEYYHSGYVYKEHLFDELPPIELRKRNRNKKTASAN